MELILTLIIAAVLLGGIWLYNRIVGATAESIIDMAFAPIGMLIDKASHKKVCRELSVAHQFRLRAPVERVQQTLENLPGIPNTPPTVLAPIYVAKEPGRTRFGIANMVLANEYDIEVRYRPESFGTSGQLRFLRWPDDAADDAEHHRHLIESIFGELGRLDSELQVRRPETAS